jgi:hypothetical protein
MAQRLIDVTKQGTKYVIVNIKKDGEEYCFLGWTENG